MDMDQTDTPVKIVYVDRKPDPLEYQVLCRHAVQYHRDKLSKMSHAMQEGFNSANRYLGYIRDHHEGLATVPSAVQFVEWIRPRYAATTLQKEITAVKAFFKWMVSLEMIDERQNPWRNVALPKPPPRPPPNEERLITPEQYRLLRHHAVGRMAEWLILLGWNTGMALVDCCTLQWQHVLLDQYCIRRARNKTGSWSTIPYPQNGELDWALREKWKVAQQCGQDKPEDPVSPEHVRPISARGSFDLVRDEAGLHDITFHAFRYTFASMLMASGMSQIQASKVTGHQTVEMLNHYTILRSDDLRGPIERAKQMAGRDQDVTVSVEAPRPPVGSRALGWGFQPGKRYEIKFDRQPRLPDGRRIHLVLIPEDQRGASARAWPVDLAGNRLLGDETIDVRYSDCRKWRES